MPGGLHFSSEESLEQINNPESLRGSLSTEPLNILPKFGTKGGNIPHMPDSTLSTEPLKVLPNFGRDIPTIFESELSPNQPSGIHSNKTNISSEGILPNDSASQRGINPNYEKISTSLQDTIEELPKSINIESPTSSGVGPSIPDSSSQAEISFTKGRYAPLSLNVKEPFSETPVITPESSQIETNKN
jgi:hypothetical protein